MTKDYAIIDGEKIYFDEPFEEAPDKADFYEAVGREPEPQRVLGLLAELVSDERHFVSCYRVAVDDIVSICNYCHQKHRDEYQIRHLDICPISRARSLLQERRDWQCPRCGQIYPMTQPYCDCPPDPDGWAEFHLPHGEW